MNHPRATILAIMLFAFSFSDCSLYTQKATTDKISSSQVNDDRKIASFLKPNQTETKRIDITYEGESGQITLILTKQCERFDLNTTTVERQVVNEKGFGPNKSSTPVWVDVGLGSALLIAGGTAIALGTSQSNQNDVQYRTNPNTGVKERKESPNSSDQDAYYAAGGSAVGVSIPFLISGIYYGAKTKDTKIGPIRKVDIQERKNVQPFSEPLRSVDVTVEYPNGLSRQLRTDSDGRIVVDLPNDISILFPLTRLASVIIPGVEQRIDIPADGKAIRALPVQARKKTDQLADALREAKARYESAKTNYNQTIGSAEAAVSRILNRHPVYTINGEIKDWSEEAIQVWGYAIGEQGEGFAPQPTNIVVIGYDKGQAGQGGYTHYYGQHYFIEKMSGSGYFGQSVPVRVYGPNPPDKNGELFKARLYLELQKTTLGDQRDKAKQIYDSAVAEYKTALPTDPYEIMKNN